MTIYIGDDATTKSEKIIAFCRAQVWEPYVFGESGMDEWNNNLAM